MEQSQGKQESYAPEALLAEKLNMVCGKLEDATGERWRCQEVSEKGVIFQADVPEKKANAVLDDGRLHRLASCLQDGVPCAISTDVLAEAVPGQIALTLALPAADVLNAASAEQLVEVLAPVLERMKKRMDGAVTRVDRAHAAAEPSFAARMAAERTDAGRSGQDGGVTR